MKTSSFTSQIKYSSAENNDSVEWLKFIVSARPGNVNIVVSTRLSYFCYHSPSKYSSQIVTQICTCCNKTVGHLCRVLSLKHVFTVKSSKRIIILRIIILT